MALSRLAKKFRELEKQQVPSTTTTSAPSKKTGKTPVKAAPPEKAPEPATPPAVEAAPEPAVAAEPPKPGKRSREVPKRPRFVYVPTKTERKVPPATPTPAVAQRSNKLSAKLMTKNLALPPEEETPGGLLGAARGRV